MASPTGVDKERSDEEREQSECNPKESEQSHFLQAAKNDHGKKKKAWRGKSKFAEVRIYFFAGIA